MNRKKIVAGNWKMNLNVAEATHLATAICSQLIEKPQQAEVVLIPPFTFITEVRKILAEQSGIAVGAQNCYTRNKGAYTGEVSASMLASVGCKYVLVGHSERRLYFKETNEELTLKIKEALKENIKPIFCIGETLEERNSNSHFGIVSQQLIQVLATISHQEFGNIIIAYEPVWAIGTGLTATTEQAQEMHAHIRVTISKIYNAEIANNTSILYGGSCNAQNAQSLFACPDVDGGLIGGASLKATDFFEIITAF